MKRSLRRYVGVLPFLADDSQDPAGVKDVPRFLWNFMASALNTGPAPLANGELLGLALLCRSLRAGWPVVIGLGCTILCMKVTAFRGEGGFVFFLFLSYLASGNQRCGQPIIACKEHDQSSLPLDMPS